MQYCLDEFGDFTDIPSAYIADATQGGTATQVTPIDVILPPEANNILFLEIRVMTVNAVGDDEWIGIDDIATTGTPTVFPSVCVPIVTRTKDPDLFPDPDQLSFVVTSGEGTITVDPIDSGTGLQTFTVVNATNATVNIPEFTPGTYERITATYMVINPALPIDITLRATSQYHGVIIRLRCGN